MILIEENLSSPEACAAGVPGNLTPGGNMPLGFLTRLFGMNASPSSRRPLFWGRIRSGGVLGLFLRPFRIGKRNAFAPKLLVAANPKADYEPRLQKPLDDAVRQAVRRFPQRVREGVRRHMRGRP